MHGMERGIFKIKSLIAVEMIRKYRTMKIAFEHRSSTRGNTVYNGK